MRLEIVDWRYSMFKIDQRSHTIYQISHIGFSLRPLAFSAVHFFSPKRAERCFLICDWRLLIGDIRCLRQIKNCCRLLTPSLSSSSRMSILRFKLTRFDRRKTQSPAERSPLAVEFLGSYSLRPFAFSAVHFFYC